MRALKSKIFATIIAILLIAQLFGCAGEEKKINPDNCKYKMVSSNWWTTASCYFDYYEKDGDFYKFYKKDSTLVSEWQKPKGWFLVIEPAQSK